MKAAAVVPSFAGLAKALSGPGHTQLPFTPAAHSCTAPALQLDIQWYIQGEIPLGWRQVFLLLSAFVPRFLEHDTPALLHLVNCKEWGTQEMGGLASNIWIISPIKILLKAKPQDVFSGSLPKLT